MKMKSSIDVRQMEVRVNNLHKLFVNKNSEYTSHMISSSHKV